MVSPTVTPRIERTIGILEDDLDLLAMRLQQPARQFGYLAAGKAHAAGGRIDQADDAGAPLSICRSRFRRRCRGCGPLRRVSVTSLAAATFAGFAEERTFAIDLAQFVGLKHDGFGGLRARRARGTRLGTEESRFAGIFHGRRAQDAVRAFRSRPAGRSASPRRGRQSPRPRPMSWVDEQHRGAVIALQVADQGQDLLLRGDVERRGRLVRN